MTTDSLEVIRRWINMGDRVGAKVALIDFLRTDPDAIDAWALMAILLRDPAQQAECYRQILRIDPENRQAAMWLEALSGPIPDSSHRAEDARSVDSVLMELASLPSPAAEPHLEGEPVDLGIEELDLAGLDADTRRLLGLGLDSRPSDQGVLSPEVRAGEKGFLARMASRLTGSSLDSQVWAGSLGRRGALPRSRELTPDEIIRLAGGPLSPEERRNCPKCGAVVSRSQNKCPWCSEPLSTSEAG